MFVDISFLGTNNPTSFLAFLLIVLNKGYLSVYLSLYLPTYLPTLSI